MNELQQLSPMLAGISRVNPYLVPAGYFESLPSVIEGEIRLQGVDTECKNSTFQVPAGYFEQLPLNILNIVKRQDANPVSAELEELAPILNTISKEPVYRVPDGYFESLELTIPLKLDKPSARVFSFGRTGRRVMQYSMAAVFAAILVMGAWYLNSGNNEQAAVITYDSALKMNVARELSAVNEQEIATYLEESPTVGYVINNTTNDDIDIQEYIHTASDDEIRQYLNETADPGEPRIKGS